MSSSFEQQLHQVRVMAGTTFSAKAQQIMKEGIEIVQASLEQQPPLTVGDVVPFFDLPNLKHRRVSLQTLLNRGPVVLSFYRGTWCPFCMTEFRALLEILPAIEALQATLVLVSPQQSDLDQMTVVGDGEHIVVLQDADNQLAEQFGIVYPFPPDLISVHQEYGVDLSVYNNTHLWRLPVPATYVVKPSGQIHYAFIDADYTRRLDPVEIVTVLRKLGSESLSMGEV